jgi:hypothetical protein
METRRVEKIEDRVQVRRVQAVEWRRCSSTSVPR